jgi:endoglucanase
MERSPKSPRPTRRARAALVMAALAVTGLTSVAVSGPASAAPIKNTSQFKGVNWADPRDNFADDPVVLSGLSLSDGYAKTFAKAIHVINGFRANLGANTVRLPINPYTVDGTYWRSYRGVIDAAAVSGFKVILSYWEGTGPRKDGLIDDPATYWPMWNTVVRAYQRNPLVYFEPMNEPHGYTETEWADIAARWLATYPSVPRNRVFVSGAGYNDHVTSVCADPRLNGTYLSLHHYGFWKDNATYAEWTADLKERIGTCASRTVADEFGAPMTTGLNYNGSNLGDNFISYLQAVTDTFRQLKMGSVYWPGLRTDDTYTMETLTGSGSHLGLTTTNQSGADRLAWGWGRGKPAQG